MVFSSKDIKNIDVNAGPFFIIRAEGTISYRVAAQLLETGKTVRVSLSDSSFAKEMFEKGAEISQFNWDKTETYAPALVGIKTVFCTIPHLNGAADKFHAFTMACKAAGVKNFIKLSFSHALVSRADSMRGFAMANDKEDPYLKVPVIQMHRACDEHLIKMGRSFNYAILFASHFMSNHAVYQGQHILQERKIYGASHGKPVNYVSPNDVAEVAVRTLLNPKNHHNVGYRLVGPSAITDDEVARHFGHKLGMEIRYVDQKNVDEFASKIKDPDWGPKEDVLFLELLKATGVEAKETSGDIAKVCGHPAESFEEYLQAQQMMSPLEMSYLKAPGVTV